MPAMMAAVSLAQARGHGQLARDRHLLGRDADKAAPDPAVLQQLCHHERRGVAGDGEADVVGAGDDGGVDAHHLAPGRDQRAAGVAGVQRRVGLDKILDQPAGVAAQGAADGGDHAGGDGGLEPQRVADRHHQLAAPERLESPSLAAGRVTGLSILIRDRSV